MWDQQLTQQSNVQYVDVALHNHATKLSHICIFNHTVPHRRNTPVPTINTVIPFYGICTQISLTGLLGVEIEGITLNVGPPASPPMTSAEAPADDGGSLSKECCFQVHASPTCPFRLAHHFNKCPPQCEFYIIEITL